MCRLSDAHWPIKVSIMVCIWSESGLLKSILVYLVLLWFWTLTFWCLNSEILNTLLTNIFDWQAFIHYLFWWSYVPKIAFWSEVVTLIFDICASGFKKFEQCSKKSLDWQMLIPDTMHGIKAPELYLLPNVVVLWPWPLTFGLQLFKNIRNCPILPAKS